MGARRRITRAVDGRRLDRQSDPPGGHRAGTHRPGRGHRSGSVTDVVEIVEYDPSWPEAFREVAGPLRMALGDNSVSDRPHRLHLCPRARLQGRHRHPGVGRTRRRPRWCRPRTGGGRLEHSAPNIINIDHQVPGWPEDERARRKRFFKQPPGSRHVNLHVRVIGRANQRYPLLFRDYLRAHPESAQAYATLKRDLAVQLKRPRHLPGGEGRRVRPHLLRR